MSWSTSVEGNLRSIPNKVARVELPEHSDKSGEHQLQLHLAKIAALKIIEDLPFLDEGDITVYLNGHNYIDTAGKFNFSIGVSLQYREHTNGNKGVSTNTN